MRSFRYTCAIFGLCLFALCHAGGGSMSLAEGAAALPDCARTCVQTAIAQSSCSASATAECLCDDDKFNDAATACIQSSCTVKESLTAKNITSLTCGVTPTTDGSLIPLYSVFTGLAVIAVTLRVVARVLTRAYFWWDDLANLFGFIGSALFTAVSIYSIQHGQSTDIWFVPFDNVTLVLRMFFAQMLIYTTTRLFIRASIILFYLRVFPPRPDSKLGRILQFTLVFNAIYNVSFLFAVIFQCNPISYFWTRWEGTIEGYCGNSTVLVWVAASTGIAFDLWLLALPFPQLLALNLSWKKKVMGGAMFVVGIAVVIISLVRLKTIEEFTQHHNPTKSIAQLCLWSGLELDVGVICPCLPSFRLLLRRLWPAVMGTSGRYEMDPISNPTGATRSGIRRSLGARMEPGGGKIMVESTIAIKYASTDSADDGDERSCASVTELVQGGMSVEAEAGGRTSRSYTPTSCVC